MRMCELKCPQSHKKCLLRFSMLANRCVLHSATQKTGTSACDHIKTSGTICHLSLLHLFLEEATSFQSEFLFPCVLYYSCSSDMETYITGSCASLLLPTESQMWTSPPLFCTCAPAAWLSPMWLLEISEFRQLKRIYKGKFPRWSILMATSWFNGHYLCYQMSKFIPFLQSCESC